MFSFKQRLRLGVLALALCLAQAGPGQANEEVYRKVASSTALIYKTDGGVSSVSGTGFLIDAQARLLVTARHVVENSNGDIAYGISVLFAESRDGDIITDARYYRKQWPTQALRGTVVYESVRRDMAIIQVEKLPNGIKALDLAAKRARPGQMVHVVGNGSSQFGGVFSYCQGYVRNAFVYEELGARVVGTQVPMNKGDSGGPMVNSMGEVVGFVCMSTGGGMTAKDNPFYHLQVTGFSVCVSEIREGVQDMRRLLAERDNPLRPESQKVAGFKGEARPGLHVVTMEKGVLYRILVKADSFVPEVRIDSVLTTPLTLRPHGLGSDWEHLFTPKETKTYRIQIAYSPSRAVAKGALPYALSVDQVTFVSEAAIKEPQLKLNEHLRKMEAGKVYKITVRGKGFEPDVQVLDGTKSLLMRFNDGKRASAGGTQQFFESVGLAKAEFETSFVFVAAKTAEYRILVAVSPFSPAGSNQWPYTVQIAEEKLHLSVHAQLTAEDPIHPRGGPFKSHPVKLEVGKSYQIDLITSAFDSQMWLEDASGKAIAQGFDVEGLNSRLIFRPTKTDTYRVVANARFDGRGAYIVTGVETSNAPAGMPNFEMKQPKAGK